jgi:membrane associated rhomboid family serine protease
MLFPIYDENPAKTVPWITLSLILTNVLVFVYELSLQSAGKLQQLFQIATLIPYEITHGVKLVPHISNIGILAIFTSMFMHGGWLHIIGNMWYLWIFGNNIEESLGHFKYLFFYLLCGVGGAIGHIISQPNSQVPTLGASGAIAGVLAAYLIRFPNARIVTIVPIFFFIQIIRLPALLLIGLWFFIQIASGVGSLSTQTSGGVAWFAHIGGFITGILLVLILPKKKARKSEDY